jgi:hypothetical protein
VSSEPDGFERWLAERRERRAGYWLWLAAAALAVAAVFLFAALLLGALGRGPFAASRPSKATQARTLAASGAATVERSHAVTEALKAGGALATTFASTGQQNEVEGTKIVHDFLRQVGFPLGEKGITAAAKILWKRYGTKDPKPIEGLNQSNQTINLVVLVRDNQGRLKVIYNKQQGVNAADPTNFLPKTP